MKTSMTVKMTCLSDENRQSYSICSIMIRRSNTSWICISLIESGYWWSWQPQFISNVKYDTIFCQTVSSKTIWHEYHKGLSWNAQNLSISLELLDRLSNNRKDISPILIICYVNKISNGNRWSKWLDGNRRISTSWCNQHRDLLMLPRVCFWNKKYWFNSEKISQYIFEKWNNTESIFIFSRLSKLVLIFRLFLISFSW